MGSGGIDAPTVEGSGGATAARPTVRAPKGTLRKLAGESALYGFGAAATQVVNVVLTPFYARVLGLDGVGEIAILNTTTLLVFTIAGFALAQSFFRHYVREARDAQQRAHVMGVSMSLRAIVASIVVVAYLLIAPLLAERFIEDPADRAALLLVGPIVLLDAIGQGPLQWLRGERRPRPFVVLSLGRALVAGLLAIVAVGVLGQGLVGVALANLAAAGAAMLVGLALVRRGHGRLVGWDPALARAMLSFSFPLVPAAVAIWALSLSDRYLLRAFEDATVVGTYVVGYTLGALVSIVVVQPFSLAWSAAKWEVAPAPDGPAQVERTHRLVGIAAAAVALGISALGVDVLRVFVPAAADDGRWIVPASAFGYAIFATYAVVSTALTLRDRTGRLGALTIAAGAANIVLNLALIPLFGMIGAGVTTVLTYGLLSLGTVAASPRGEALSPRLWPTWGPLLVAGPLALAALFGPDALWWRIACIAVFPIVVLALGWLRPELDALRHAASRSGG